MMTAIEQYPDGMMLARAAAVRVIALAGEAIGAHGCFTIAMAGGNTPRALCRLLAHPSCSEQVDWQQVHVFWGDERCVPPDNADSNYRMAAETLLTHVPVSHGNIHRMRGELSPPEAAREYEAELRAFFTGDAFPRFDLVLLGLGGDAHTASLFPETDALHETRRWTVANTVPQLQSWRLTLTVPAINSAKAVIFLVEGENKAQAVHDVLCGPWDPCHLPAQLITPTDGDLFWMLDTPAAGLLPPGG